MRRGEPLSHKIGAILWYLGNTAQRKYTVMLFTLRNISVMFLAATAVLLVCIPSAKGAENSPAGLWKTFDDHTHKARGTVRIFEWNGTFSGRIESSFNPAELTERCAKCSDDRKDAPVIGLVILRGMTRHGSEFDGGNILDPETGSVYRCKFALSADGEKLFLRGYLGISIFGRTQTWMRMESEPLREPSVTLLHP
jgi:uncharacterized protein (DUF2147 family)